MRTGAFPGRVLPLRAAYLYYSDRILHPSCASGPPLCRPPPSSRGWPSRSLSAPTIARNAVGLTLCIVLCPVSQRGRSRVRTAMRSGHCQLVGAKSCATNPGRIGHARMPIATPPSPDHSCRFFWSARLYADPTRPRSSAMTRSCPRPPWRAPPDPCGRAALPGTGDPLRRLLRRHRQCRTPGDHVVADQRVR